MPSAIPAACSSSSPDTTDALNQFIGSVPDNMTIEFPAGACYRVEGTIELFQRNSLTFEGNGATLRSFTDGAGYGTDLAKRHHIFCHAGSNLAFDHLNIVGDNVDHTYEARYAGQAAWWVWGTQGFAVTNSQVNDVRGDFVTLGPDTYRSWVWTTNVTITGDTFDGSGRQGIAITGAQNVSISHNSMANSALSAFDIEPDSGTGPLINGVPTYGGAADVTIADNTVGAAGSTFLSNYGLAARITGIVVTRNVLHDVALVIWSKGDAKVHRGDWTITANTSDKAFASPRAAIELTYVDRATITRNTIPFYAPQKVTAVRVWGSSDVTVSDNSFPGAAVPLQRDRNWSGLSTTKVASGGNAVSG
ncbi:MAG: right-handed parallel beta-helix repeat-containing protein [Actinomycetota bacterium]|nr:right-handed parallel beta-helix repeat-containing protein [Actinomycetota bacterium]